MTYIRGLTVVTLVSKPLRVFILCMYNSCSCFMQFSPFSHIIILHLHIYIPIIIVSPNSPGLMSSVCSWWQKIMFLLLYLTHYTPKFEMLSFWGKISSSVESNGKISLKWWHMNFYVVWLLFVHSIHNRHPISSSWGQGMGYILWVAKFHLVSILFLQCCSK